MKAAAITTHAGTIGAFTLWGLSLGDTSIAISACASVIGVVIQAYMAWRKVRREDRERKELHDGEG